MAQNLMEELDEQFLQCVICMDQYIDPRLLPCGHSFCLECIEGLAERNEEMFNCPNCRSQCPIPEIGVEGLTKNHYIYSLADFMKQGNNMVGSESSIEEVVAFDQDNTVDYSTCQIHKDTPLTFFCEKCQVPICNYCSQTRHRLPEHPHTYFQEVSKEYREQLLSMVKRGEEHTKLLKERHLALREEEIRMENYTKQTEREITSEADKIIKTVKQQKSFLLNKLKENKNAQRSKIKSEMEKLKMEINAIDANTTFTKKIQEDDDIKLLLFFKEAHNQIESLITKSFSRESSAKYNMLCYEKSEAFQPGYSIGELVDEDNLESKTPKKLYSMKATSQQPNPSFPKINYVMANNFQFLGDMAFSNNGDTIVIADNHHLKVGKFKGENFWNWETIDLDGGHAKFVAINKKGQILYTDFEENECRLCDISGENRKFTTIGKFENPSGVTTSNNGNIYIADIGTHTIYIKNKKGELIRTIGFNGAGNHPGQFNVPGWVAVNKRNDIIVSDINNNRVQVFNHKGEFIYKFGSEGKGDGEFGDIRGVTVDENDNIYVCDCGNDRIQMFNPDGKFICVLKPEGLEKPWSIAIVTHYIHVGLSWKKITMMYVASESNKIIYTLRKEAGNETSKFCVIQ